MRRPVTFAARLLMMLAVVGLASQPIAAQSSGPSILRDSETEALLKELVDPLAEAAGLQRGAVQVVLVNDPSINAFVAGGQRIYIHSGLINAADHATEVQGVLAHEMGHIAGGHSISIYDGAGKAGKIQLLSMLAGIAAALAGAPEAGSAISALGSQAALGTFLSFTRTQESSADAASVKFLSAAGISGKGTIAFFHKLQGQEFRYAIRQDEEAGFASTHPLTGDRISRLEGDLEKDPAWDTAADGAQERRFQRVKAKLYGYLAKPADTMNHFPAYLTDVPARYARAYAYHKDARMDAALDEVNALIATAPSDPYFLELKGQVLLESGRAEDAIAPLRQATELTHNDPLIASTFGHALIASESTANYGEAEKVLRAAVAKDRENPFAWYQLGVVYAANGDLPRARLASAEQQIMSAEPKEALRNAEAAESALPAGSPDWLRAQDVAMQARAELERSKDRH
ncbi:MAG: M48 family metalloprotease [Croceibacterium sp.]